MMTNELKVRLCFPGLEGNPWPGTSQLPTRTQSLTYLLATTQRAGAAADKEMNYSDPSQQSRLLSCQAR